MDAGMVRVMPDIILLKEYRLNELGIYVECRYINPNQQRLINMQTNRKNLEAEILRRMKNNGIDIGRKNGCSPYYA